MIFSRICPILNLQGCKPVVDNGINYVPYINDAGDAEGVCVQEGRCSKQLKYSLNSFNKQVRLLLCLLSRFKTQVNLLKLLREEEEREEEREEIVNE